MQRNKSKRTELLAYRITPDEKLALLEIADEMQIRPSKLTGILMDSFVKARTAHGKRLVWPLELNYRAGRK
jgi:hypothetical protein